MSTQNKFYKRQYTTECENTQEKLHKKINAHIKDNNGELISGLSIAALSDGTVMFGQALYIKVEVTDPEEIKKMISTFKNS